MACKFVPLCLFLFSPAPIFFSHAQQNEDSWNALIFAQHWPITSCIDHLSKNPNASCNLFLNVTTWAVHGLWPTNLGSMGPSFCNTSWHFIEKKIADIEPNLLKYWPNIYGERSISSLWKHEWLKHGTCAAQITKLDTEHKYFSQGIEFVKAYDLVSILGNKKIYPSDEKEYENDAIISAVKYYFNRNPIIDCTYDSKSHKHQLSQIKLCFNRMLQMIDCDKLKEFSALQNHGNCPDTGLFYPSSVRTNNLTYHYPMQLAKTHTALWFKTNSCSSWLCKAFKMLRALSLLTF